VGVCAHVWLYFTHYATDHFAVSMKTIKRSPWWWQLWCADIGT